MVGSEVNPDKAQWTRNPFPGIPVAVVASSSSSFHSVVITAEGQVYSWGRADKGQIGTGEAKPKPIGQPTLIKALQVRKELVLFRFAIVV